MWGAKASTLVDAKSRANSDLVMNGSIVVMKASEEYSMIVGSYSSPERIINNTSLTVMGWGNQPISKFNLTQKKIGKDL